ncbi:MAG: hypothetical protein WC942_01465 [Clostridia bacterium]|jgi:hypothetical protein
MVQKTARRQRSKRKDPIQEEIVSRKDALNARTTRFINLIIELKRGWNGNPVPEIGLDHKTKLTDPLPDQVINVSNTALSEFGEIVSGLKEIGTLQNQYSNNREQRISERTQQFEQLASLESQFEKTASNVLSRIWSHIKAPFSSDSNKWERLRLLRSLARFVKNLREIDEKVLSGDEDILEAVYLAKTAYSDIKTSFFDENSKIIKDTIEQIEKNVDKKNIPIVLPMPSPIGDKKLHDNTLEDLENKLIQKGVIKKIKTPQDDFEYIEDGIEGVAEEGSSEMPPGFKPFDVFPASSKPVPVKQPELPVKLQDKSAVPPVSSGPIFDFKQELDLPDDEPVYYPDSDFSEPSAPIPNDPESIGFIDELLQDEDDDVPEIEPVDFVDEISDEEEEAPHTLRSTELESIKHKLQGKELFDYLKNNAKSLIEEIREKIKNPEDIPDPWGQRIYDQYDYIKSALKSFMSSKKKFVENYLRLVKFICDLHVTISAYESEKIAIKHKPTITIGSSLDENRLENHSNILYSKYEREVAELLGKTAGDNFNMFVKEAGALNRLLRRTLTNLSFKKDKQKRLHIDRLIKQCINEIDSLMNILEGKYLNYVYIIKASVKFYNLLSETFLQLAELAEMHNDRLRIYKSQQKKENQKFRDDFIRDSDINKLKNINRSLVSDMNGALLIQKMYDKTQEELDEE